MKVKRSFAAIVLGLSAVAAFAQTGDDTRQVKEEGTTVFKPHWYMQVQGGASHTFGEGKFGDLISPAVALNVGYQISPLWGVRAGLSGWEAKGGAKLPTGTSIYKYNYLQGNVDATLDLSALFCRYNPTRVFNAYALAGVGVNGAFNNDDMTALYNNGYKPEYYWDCHKVSVVGRMGLGVNLRLSSHVAFNIEANSNFLSDKYNSKKGGNVDWQFNLLGGFTFRFGKTTKKTEPVYYDPAPVQPAPAPAPVVVEEQRQEPTAAVVQVEPMQQNIVFLINSAVIRPQEVSKMDALVQYLNEHPNAKVVVRGYADKETGTPAINMRLSEKRVASVLKVLKERGVADSRITTEAKGDTEQPFGSAKENRVSVCIAE